MNNLEWVVVVLYQLCAGNTCQYFNDGHLEFGKKRASCIEAAYEEDQQIYELENGAYIKSIALCINDGRKGGNE